MCTLHSIIICNFAFFRSSFPFLYMFFFLLFHRYLVRSTCTQPLTLYFAFSYQHIHHSTSPSSIHIFLYLITSLCSHIQFVSAVSRIRFFSSFLLVFSSFKFSNSLGFSFDWVMLCAATQYSRYDGRRKRNSSTSRDPSFKPG